MKYLWLFTLSIVCIEFLLGLVQIMVSIHYDADGSKWKYFPFCPMYLAFTWGVNLLTVVWTFPKAFKVVTGHGGDNAWSSPR